MKFHIDKAWIRDQAEKEKDLECKGLIFRGKKSTWLVDEEYVFCSRETLSFLKKKSCSGCNKCDWLWDDLKEHIDYPLQNRPSIVDGELYKLTVTNISTDWESGVVDGYNLEFLPYKET